MDEGLRRQIGAYHAPRYFTEIEDIPRSPETSLCNDCCGLGEPNETSFMGVKASLEGIINRETHFNFACARGSDTDMSRIVKITRYS